MTAPTEQEVREAIDHAIRQLEDSPAGIYNDVTSHIWDVPDLRPSELTLLDALGDTIYRRIDARIRDVLIEELSPVVVQFAAEYPDAPRAREEVTA